MHDAEAWKQTRSRRRFQLVASSVLLSAAFGLALFITLGAVKGGLLEVSVEWVLGFLLLIASSALVGVLISPVVVWCLWRKRFGDGLLIVFWFALATEVGVNLLPVRFHGPHNLVAGHIILLLGCLLLSRLLRNTVPRRPGLCPECDFDLRGQSEGCPECGWEREAKRA